VERTKLKERKRRELHTTVKSTHRYEYSGQCSLLDERGGKHSPKNPAPHSARLEYLATSKISSNKFRCNFRRSCVLQTKLVPENEAIFVLNHLELS
jgi:hypothetical protein